MPTKTTEPSGLDALRTPFPRAVIGKVPKGNTQLDYVGHAAVTDRLLTVDPAWSWEPMATDEQGLPLYDKAGGLWIRLTVCGVTRLGYGDGPDPKQRIGDAIRNAAMRFGVALDLWTKGELESQDPNGGGGDTVRQQPVQRARQAPADQWATPEPPEATTDPDWRAGWVAHVSTATSKEQLRELWTDLGRAQQARQCSVADAHDLEAVWRERAADLKTPEQTETLPDPEQVPA